jgi:hypothetical protein
MSQEHFPTSLSDQQQKLAAAFTEISWSAENRVCIFRPDGVLSSKMAGRMVAWLQEMETDCAQPFSRFSDLTKLQKIEISLFDVQNLAYWRRTTYEGPLVKSAFLAQSDGSLAIAHAYLFLMAGSPIVVRVFENMQDAAAWLGVSEESLGEVKQSG